MARLKREVRLRQKKQRILIVTEGKKTECNYFKEIRSKYLISSLDVCIYEKGNPQPCKVFSCAKKLMKESEDYNPYDHIFCVMDKDDHPIDQTISDIDKENKRIKKKYPDGLYHAIISYPCFEYWYFCHFEYSRSPIVSKEMKSKLKEHIPDYSESKLGLFSELEEKITTAKKHSLYSLKESEKDNEKNPSTNVFELVDFLINLTE